MDLHRYDIIEAEIKIKLTSGSVQNKRRPYVIVGNNKGTKVSPVVIAMPLTSMIKKANLPTHGCIEADSQNGLKKYSMILGEQLFTLDKKTEIIRKIGSVTDKEQKAMIDKVCLNTLFYGENIDWKELVG